MIMDHALLSFIHVYTHTLAMAPTFTDEENRPHIYVRKIVLRTCMYVHTCTYMHHVYMHVEAAVQGWGEEVFRWSSNAGINGG